MNSNLRLSVLIVTYQSEEFIAKCIESIAKHLSGIQHEVFVLDNASSDRTVIAARSSSNHVKVISNPRNQGFSHALNLGLREARGEYILWLNPDSELLDSGLGEIMNYLDRNPRVGIAGPKIQNPDGSIQYSCRSFPNHLTAFFNRYSLFTKLFPQNRLSKKYLHTDWDRSIVHDVDWVSGACLLMRRVLLEDVGYMDERFFMYSEDVDYCLRARNLGWDIQYHPGAVILHHIGGSSRKLKSRMIIERHKSMWQYYLKHFPRKYFIDAATLSGIAIRCGYALTKDALQSYLSKYLLNDKK